MSTNSNAIYIRDHLFLTGVSMVGLSLMALFFLGISWVLGGDAFINSLYGKEIMAVLLGAVGVGAVMIQIFRDKAPKSQLSTFA